ncbi:hypothetical protein [Paraburkholderia sp.]|jgi:hypothetical protein|uniref:hypothetical protein n=1 Tax=Paraburkholderia sp. TaxID=1926495 RepID=UPI00263A2765|nr:hypothetical protein [Paraburkholderia sp.]
MRLAFRIDLRHIRRPAAICAALLLAALPPSVNAQQPLTASSPDTGSVTLASVMPAAVAAPDTPVGDTADAATTSANTSTDPSANTANTAAPVSDLAGDPLSIPVAAATTSDLALDDQALSQQRGGFGGMLMVAATPQQMSGGNGGNHVTLWDEIAPPSPMPIPVDVARSAQGNVTTYQRN